MNKSDKDWIDGYFEGVKDTPPSPAEQWLIRFQEKHTETDEEYQNWIEN